MKRINLCHTLAAVAWVSANLVGHAAWAEQGPQTQSNSYAVGPCMLNGPGAGYEMGSGKGRVVGPPDELDLSAEQRSQITAIEDDVGHKHWMLMGRIREEQSRLIELYRAEGRAGSALNTITPQIAELQQQILEHALESQNQMDSVLTREQRHQLRQAGSRVGQVRR